MLNLLKKTTPWMVASLLVATSVFAQNAAPAQGGSSAPKCPPKPCVKPCPQPTLPTQLCAQDPCCPSWQTPVLNAAYNYPARTQTRCPWDINFDVSLIYWQPVQDDMGYASVNKTLPGDLLNASVNTKIENMDFNFKPGFKIGMGGYFDHDNWDMRFEYTWFHNTNNGNVSKPSEGFIWGNNNFYEKASQSWRLNMDIVELDLGRWYYVGTKLTFRPNFGLRAAWISQKRDQKFETAVTSTLFREDTVNVSSKTNSWGLGAKTGLDANWIIGSGFRFFGTGEADLLFTNFTSTRTKTTHKDLSINGSKVHEHNVFGVNPHLDLELGFGWGTYLDCNNWYLDFSLAYGFQTFFNQNMFIDYDSGTRVKPVADNQTVTEAFLNVEKFSQGNLYVHGLTLSAKLDF